MVKTVEVTSSDAKTACDILNKQVRIDKYTGSVKFRVSDTRPGTVRIFMVFHDYAALYADRRPQPYSSSLEMFWHVLLRYVDNSNIHIDEDNLAIDELGVQQVLSILRAVEVLPAAARNALRRNHSRSGAFEQAMDEELWDDQLIDSINSFLPGYSHNPRTKK